MSGGSGGMPFGQNMGVGQGQQMQNPQMGQQMPQMGQQMGVGQGGMFGQGGTTMQTNPNMGGQIAPMQVGQQVAGGMMGGGMGSTPRFANQQGYDDFMAQGGMQGIQDRMSGIGGLLGSQMPQQGMTKKQYFEMYGAGGGPGMTMMDDSGMGRGPSFPAPSPYAYDDPRNPGYGMIDVGRGFAPYKVRRPGGPPISDPNPYGGDPGGMNYTGGSKDFDETRGAYRPGGHPLVQNPGPGRSYPINDGPMMPLRRPDNVQIGKPFTGYGPTKGPIDGRELRDMMDITKRREMDFDLKNRRGGGLPGSARDGISPSLNRPSRPTK